ncbi:hypothetical protein ACVC7V_21340 [Hydrogenophaga sp. A37]|uniref:hypothetical protein n=1 Tax=Hydrogenophaga sp. A37 TaxID=1945864 RepID=UPI00098520A6|nr:hypothetical protein [Hydrogenophaga sp. A37]OOG81539.1 hypothetical protein B0E41_17415 [Hydrogenophaga sp. A37]
MSAPLNATGYTGTVHRQFPALSRPVRADPISAEAATAWRFMRDAGGFYTAAELGAALRPELTPQRAAMTASRWLVALFRRRHIAANPRAIRIKSYGVTTRCFSIPGESLEPTNEPTTGSPE